MNVLTFDIETIPDVDAGRRLYKLGDLPDQDVANRPATRISCAITCTASWRSQLPVQTQTPLDKAPPYLKRRL